MDIYTDMAIESHDYYQEKNKSFPDGVIVNNRTENDIKTTIVEITNEIGSKNLNKPIGKYITLDIPKNHDDKSKLLSDCKEALEKALREIIEVDINEPIMVVGLGNKAITPDSLGVLASENVQATRHLFDLIPDHMEAGVRPVCCLIPGVLGNTGIETAEIIKGTVDKVKPKIVIAIDALASRKMERVASTIQISNTGLNPGGGIGNNRNKLNEGTLGIPVIAIGVPTVVEAATLANDVIDLIGSDEPPEERYQKIAQILTPSQMGNCFVTPKEIDEQMQDLSEVIASGLNMALHDVEL